MQASHLHLDCSAVAGEALVVCRGGGDAYAQTEKTVQSIRGLALIVEESQCRLVMDRPIDFADR
jgi:hypothetical protein